MNSSKNDGIGAVAIHRWFADGEGWAYHPWYESRQFELLAVLQPELDHRRELEERGRHRSFTYYAMGGVLVGDQMSDPDCKDDRAVDRNPTILRALFLDDVPSPSLRRAIIEKLVQLDAQQVGPDDNLKVTLENTASFLRTPKASQGRKPFPGLTCCLLGFLVILASLLVCLFLPTSNNTESNEVVTAADKMLTLLQKWQVEEVGQLDNKKSDQWPHQVVERFFRVLSQQEIVGGIEGEHPDAIFLRRFPPTPITNRKRWDSLELRQDLLQLHEELSRNPELNEKQGKELIKEKELSLLVDQVAKQVDYIDWWKKTGCRLNYVFGGIPNPQVSNSARQFADRRPSWEKDVAETMLKPLKKWQIKAIADEDAKVRPWLIIHCFFKVLSQEHFTEEDLQSESYPVYFVKLLPKQSLTQDGVFTSRDELIKKLNELAEYLDARQSPLESTLVTNISMQMDYGEWRKGAPRYIGKKVDAAPKKVEEFVSRFMGETRTDP